MIGRTGGTFLLVVVAFLAGGGYLAHTNPTVNGAFRRLHGMPARAAVASDSGDAGGVVLGRDSLPSAPLRISSVVAGSPAERAGLRAGDEVVSIDGKDVAALSVQEATLLLRENRLLKRTTVRRSGKTVRTFRIG